MFRHFSVLKTDYYAYIYIYITNIYYMYNVSDIWVIQFILEVLGLKINMLKLSS